MLVKITTTTEKLTLIWEVILKVECLLQEAVIKEVPIQEAELCNLEEDKPKQAIRAVFNHKVWEPKTSMETPAKWVHSLREEQIKTSQHPTVDSTTKATATPILQLPEVVKEEEV